jgi:small-conductance mechanosensitive channel
MHRRTLVWALALSSLLWAAPALAQENVDVGKLAGFIRWGGVFLSVFAVLGATLVLRIVGGLAARFGKRFANRRMLIHKVESVTRFAVYLAAAGICVGLSVHLDSTALAVIGGALAFAVGFAMRDLVAALIAGITIIFDRPFQVGDRIQYGGEYGDVIKIGLRSVRINTLDHNIVTVPNNKILTEVSASGNYGALEMQVAMEFHVGADQDLKLAMELIREACITSRYCFLDLPVPVLAKQVIIQNCPAYQIKARPYVLDVKYEKPFETDVHVRVQEAFREHAILPPALLHRRIDEQLLAAPAGAAARQIG